MQIKKKPPIWQHKLGAVTVLAYPVISGKAVRPNAYSVVFENCGRRFRVCTIDHDGQVFYGPLAETYHKLRDSREFQHILDKFKRIMEIHLVMAS
jgi:hypothetical protein